MRSFRVLSASVNPDTGFIEVVKEITADDNSTSLNLHTFHREALEWKAAEFDINNIDEVIDGILYEPFFQEDVQSLQLSTDDARTKFRSNLSSTKARLPSNGVPRDPVGIKARMRVAGVDQRYIDAVDNDPIQVIKGACPFDVQVIEAKRTHTDKVRSRAIVERAEAAARGPEGPLTVEQRIARIRANQPTTPSGDAHKQPEVPVPSAILPPIVLNGGRKREAGREE